MQQTLIYIVPVYSRLLLSNKKTFVLGYALSLPLYSVVTIYGIVLSRLGFPDVGARGCQIGVVSMENKSRLLLLRTP